MTDTVERLRDDTQMLWDAVAEKNAEIERLRADLDKLISERQGWLDEIEELRDVLQALHDWYVEYARINNLFNADGSPATFHELLEARRVLEAAA